MKSDTPTLKQGKVESHDPRAVRIEWEVPPTRGIRSSWFEEEPEFTDDEWRAAFMEKHPRAPNKGGFLQLSGAR